MITPIRHNLRDKRGQKRRFLRSVIVVPFNSSVCYVRRAAFLLVALSLLVARLVPAAEKKVDFSREVLPILSDNCFQCHGPDPKEGRKGDLRLDEEKDVKRLREGYRVVEEGHAKTSELYRRLITLEKDDRMPPAKLGRTLSPSQIETLRRWIDEGGQWGRPWAFERIERPAVKNAARHPIDELVERQWEKAGLASTPRASRETLIRRLTLDLTGLPPTPEQLDAFLADTAPGAWERLVDRTLASPAYGERMAWDWLEAARYADSNGYQGDNERTMWPWRDWVVRAFNDNLPYDQFTVWQLAGDLLPGATAEQILATGFNRNHMINGEGGRIAEENRVDYVMDMTETMGTVWLGLTLNCCRCHDHKFDPLKQREYYQLTAFFNQTPVEGGGGNAQTPPVLEVGTEEQRVALGQARAEAAARQQEVEQRAKEILPLQAEWEAARLKQPTITDWRVVKPSSAAALKQHLEILPDGAVHAGGENPATDEYELVCPLEPGDVTGFRLDALRHPDMTQGGLARSDSGNFVLTDIAFRLQKTGEAKPEALPVASAEATYEQGNFPVGNAFDKDAKSGWAVWSGKTIDRDHAAVFRLKSPVRVPSGASLQVSLKFNSPHPNHNLGHFRLSTSSAAVPALGGGEGALFAALQTPAGKRTKEQQTLVREAHEAWDTTLVKLREAKSKADELVKSRQAELPRVMVMEDRKERRPTYLLSRGLYNQPGEEVLAAVPASLPPMKVQGTPNRLDLAKWLVSRDHPLTARVTVNRLWQMLFGIGLVKTAEDFGVQGESPVQAELLDWLAAEFMESGWDVKHLLRTMVTSEAYQRSAVVISPAVHERDPDNRWLARGPRFRLPSWMIRDQALAAAGLLNLQAGGKPVYPYQPEGIWAEATFGKKIYRQDSGDALHRRSLYTFWRRIVGPTMFFDTAKRQVCEVKPLRTNTPMHALTTLNDVTFVEAARVLAQTLLGEESDDLSRMRLAGRRLLARDPGPEELVLWQRSLDRARKAYDSDPESARTFLTQGESQRDCALPVPEQAAWAAFCLSLMNLDETLNKE